MVCPKSRRLAFMRVTVLSAFVILFVCCGKEASAEASQHHTEAAGSRPRIAIIGGGIGGTFAARYLAQYDSSFACKIDSISLFDPSPQLSTPDGGRGRQGGPPTGGGGELGKGRQGSRVSSLTLSDGTVVELGASIIFSGNELLTEVVDNDASLQKAAPLSPGKDGKSREDVGMGIYAGDGQWPLIIHPETPFYVVVARMLYRYGMDVIKVRNAAFGAFKKFSKIYQLLNSTSNDSFFDSPVHLWKAVGLHEMTTMSFDAYLDRIGVSGGSSPSVASSSWRNFLYEWVLSFLESMPSFFAPWLEWVQSWLLPPRGNMRREICESVNINNYNQNNGRLNGLAGLVSFLPTQGSVYSILGGNAQLLSSSFKQAIDLHASSCNASGSIRHVQSSVTSISISDDSIELITDGKGSAGHFFDVVILAAPLQESQIKFTPPLKKFPSSASRRYTETITTIIVNGTLQSEHFHISNTSMPRAVSMTEKGKESEGFSCLAELTDDGTFKVFSSQPLSKVLLEKLFGNSSSIEYQKIWGGDFGGAYPDFAGGGKASASAPFMLHGDDAKGAALYYVNAMEASVAAMEISAIGAKAVSKLVALRLGLLA